MSEEKPGRVKLNDKLYEFPEDFKVKEYRVLTEWTGKTAMSEIDFSDPNAIAAIAYILLKREDSAFTKEQVEDVTVRFLEDDEEADAGPPVAQPTPIHPAASGVLS